MSSTNRGAKRNKYDYYVTPIIDIVIFLEEFKKKHQEYLTMKNVLDPSAGGDLEREMSYPEAIKVVFPMWKVETSDLRHDSKANHTNIDYLTVDINDLLDGYVPEIIFTNPPFNIAMDFIKKALDDVKDDGLVIMLLRLNFLGSKERNNWLKTNMPYEIYVHSKRMSFIENKSTDSIEYAHFIWKKGYKGITKLYLLEYPSR